VFPNPEKPSQELIRVTSSVSSPRFGPIGLGLVFRDVAEARASPRLPTTRGGGRLRAAVLVTEAGHGRDPWRVHLALLGAQSGFALFPIFGKLALATIPAMVFAAFRVVAASALLLLLRRVAGGERLAPGHRGPMLLYALLGVSFNQVLFILGLSLTSAINTTILTAMIPVYTLCAAALLGHETFHGAGRGSDSRRGSRRPAPLEGGAFRLADDYFRGDLLLVANGISYAFYLVLSRPILAHYRVLTVVSGVFTYGALPIVAAAMPALRRFSPAVVTPVGWRASPRSCSSAPCSPISGTPGPRPHARLPGRLLRLRSAAQSLPLSP
jgi:drug/metabolite transporter (DMT)-like permease